MVLTHSSPDLGISTPVDAGGNPFRRGSSAIPSQPRELFRCLNTDLVEQITSSASAAVYLHVLIFNKLSNAYLYDRGLLLVHCQHATQVRNCLTTHLFFLKSFEVPALVTFKVVCLRFRKIQQTACIIPSSSRLTTHFKRALQYS